MVIKKEILICLLFALPLALLGQVNLPKHQSDGWRTTLDNGGIVRKNRQFISLENGIGDFVGMNFVDGYTLGPKATFGIINKNYSRWEIDEDIKWGFSREKLMAKGVLRYVFQPQYFGFLEIFGGRFTTDFDRTPRMDEYQQGIAASLFGWNHNKLYEQTNIGLRGSVALAYFLQMRGEVAWEKRTQVENHRKCSVFGKKGKTNVPFVQNEPMADFAEDKLLRMNLGFDFTPGRRIIVSDDITSTSESQYPTFSLMSSAGVNDGLRFLSLELSIAGKTQMSSKDNQLQYFVSGGFFPVEKQVLLIDYHHFDASRFAWQRNNTITWFSLLDNYELSTSKRWLEGHIEWDYKHLYAQVHAVKVPDMPAHEEVSLGVDVMDVRIGASVGFNDADYDGVAFNLILNLNKLSKDLKKITK